MQFYGREQELKTMAAARKSAFGERSHLTIVTGGKRAGKTRLVRKSCDEGRKEFPDCPTVYLFVDRSNEAMLCSGFVRRTEEALGKAVQRGMFYGVKTFDEFFRRIMQVGAGARFNLVIDEFQELANINSQIYRSIRSVWDEMRDDARVNLILCGTEPSRGDKMFADYKDVLYQICDHSISLGGFTCDELRRILGDFKPGFNSQDLLALYAFTGGTPRYVECFMDNNATDMKAMAEVMTRRDSFFRDEGRVLLTGDFGKKSGTYFSILSAVANGSDNQPELSGLLGEASINGHLKRLEEDYGLLRHMRPMFSRESSQAVRYEIPEVFVNFWFRYFFRCGYLAEMNAEQELCREIIDDYPRYSEIMLKKFFRKQMAESGLYAKVGQWWQPSRGYFDSRRYDIDIITIDRYGALGAADVKISGNPAGDTEELLTKVAYLSSLGVLDHNISEEEARGMVKMFYLWDVLSRV